MVHAREYSIATLKHLDTSVSEYTVSNTRADLGRG